jgi:hypothetical protein
VDPIPILTKYNNKINKNLITRVNVTVVHKFINKCKNLNIYFSVIKM